ncbi:hypothetical protein TNCV_4310011 [Trichonephila clavipes]|nr:hypothetical protein TNCV_4310011 [Trichonephila clavipes]
MPIYIHPSDRYMWKRLFTLGNLFPVINSPIEVLVEPDEAYSFVPSSQLKFTSGPSALKTYMNKGTSNSSLADLVGAPSLKSEAI